MTSTASLDGPAAAASLRDLTATESELSERGRTLTERTVDALWDSGLMQLFNPKEAGGAEPSFTEMIETWIELAWQDGSLGWIGIANFPSAAASAAVLLRRGVRGGLHPQRQPDHRRWPVLPERSRRNGRRRVPAHRRLELRVGHRPLALRGCGLHPDRNGEMVVAENGLPPLMVAVIPHEEIVFTDGWFVQGLKGTGSYDYNVTELFVPEPRTYELFCRTPRRRAVRPPSAWDSSRSPPPDTGRGRSASRRACSTT